MRERTDVVRSETGEVSDDLLEAPARIDPRVEVATHAFVDALDFTFRAEPDEACLRQLQISHMAPLALPPARPRRKAPRTVTGITRPLFGIRAVDR